MRRLFSFVFAVATALLTTSGTAGAADVWRATKVAGEVRVEIAGAQAVPLTLEMAISAEASIETAASGSATLVRGEESVVVAPNSRLRLPAPSADGFTRVIEEFGSLFFRVGKKTTPHFRVETPLLAATVKGTAFKVTVDHKGANVDVTEGLVLVQNNASADETLVPSGRTASVIVNQPLSLYLDRNIVPPNGMRLRLRPADDHADALPADQPRTAQSGFARGAAQGANTDLTIAIPKIEMHKSPTALVIDSTLTGVGFGIIAAALAIVMIGANWRRPGLATAKVKRVSKSEQK